MKLCMQPDKLRTLLKTNVEWLRQAESLLAATGDWEYSNPAPAHLRHVLEFYEAFIDAAATGFLDYDARRRDPQIERSRTIALERIQTLAAQLQNLSPSVQDSFLEVRIEDADPALGQECWLCSSIGRELQFLSSHTVHHFALIAVALRAHDIAVPADFGVSPATLRYRREAA